MTDPENTIAKSGSKADIDVKKPLPPSKPPREWIKANWLWIVAHIFNFAYALKCYREDGSLQIFSVVIFMCIIFVQLYTDPIKPLPPEGSGTDERNKIEEERSQQRNKWMIFAYSFMLLSLWLTFSPFINPLFQPNKPPVPDKKQYLETLHERPIAVFIGCSLDPKANTLRCETKSGAVETAEGEGGKKDDKATETAKGDQGKRDGSETGSGKAEENAKFGSAWVINIGGSVKTCTNTPDEFGKSVICEVKDGLLVPLYFIIMALMGGSISLTRRLPELQKQAGSEHIATEKQPKLSQYEFREHLIFQMVQFISAPFLAILAYYLIEPSNTTNAVILAFTAGFASETILLMVRSIANKITPENNAVPQYGAVTGVVTWNDKDPSLRKPAEKIEVSLSGSPQIQSITDAQGFYILGNVPVGDHSILFTSTESVETKEIVKIDRAQAIIKKNITIEKKT